MDTDGRDGDDDDACGCDDDGDFGRSRVEELMTRGLRLGK